MAIRISGGLHLFSNVVDRFMATGYRDDVPFEEQLRLASEVSELDALTLAYPGHFEDPHELQTLLDKYNLKVNCLLMGIVGEPKWKMGSFTSTDPAIRREAIDVVKRGLDVSATMGLEEILLWLGQDGFEYPFQANYDLVWDYLVDGIGEVAEHRPDIRIALEPKPFEPRVRSYIDTTSKALLLCEEIGLPNVGITLDMGHALNAGETIADSVVLCAKCNRLFQIHANDNDGNWDWDMLPGQIHFWTTLEFFYWLNKLGYDGWVAADVYPLREDGAAIMVQCARNIRRFVALAASLTKSPLEQMQETGDAAAISELLWRETIKF